MESGIIDALGGVKNLFDAWMKSNEQERCDFVRTLSVFEEMTNDTMFLFSDAVESTDEARRQDIINGLPDEIKECYLLMKEKERQNGIVSSILNCLVEKLKFLEGMAINCQTKAIILNTVMGMKESSELIGGFPEKYRIGFDYDVYQENCIHLFIRLYDFYKCRMKTRCYMLKIGSDGINIAPDKYSK